MLMGIKLNAVGSFPNRVAVDNRVNVTRYPTCFPAIIIWFICIQNWSSEKITIITLQWNWKVTIITYGYGSMPISTIFSGMNIHLPAILMFTRGYKVLTHCHILKSCHLIPSVSVTSVFFPLCTGKDRLCFSGLRLGTPAPNANKWSYMQHVITKYILITLIISYNYFFFCHVCIYICVCIIYKSG